MRLRTPVACDVNPAGLTCKPRLFALIRPFDSKARGREPNGGFMKSYLLGALAVAGIAAAGEHGFGTPAVLFRRHSHLTVRNIVHRLLRSICERTLGIFNTI